MKKILYILFFLSMTVFAQKGQFGAGIIIGEPTGLSAKFNLGSGNAIDAGLAWSFKNPSGMHVHADYLYHAYNLIRVSSGKLPVYFGIGGRIKFKNNEAGSNNDNSATIGVRIPVGLSYEFATAPLDLFLEIAPTLNLAPKTEFDLNGAIGLRFYFE